MQTFLLPFSTALEDFGALIFKYIVDTLVPDGKKKK